MKRKGTKSNMKRKKTKSKKPVSYKVCTSAIGTAMITQLLNSFYKILSGVAVTISSLSSLNSKFLQINEFGE
jgi:hypothetical protein